MQSEVLFYTIPEKVKGGFEVNMGCVLVYQYTRNETLTNCITTPCMDMKTIGIPPCTGTPEQPLNMYWYSAPAPDLILHVISVLYTFFFNAHLQFLVVLAEKGRRSQEISWTQQPKPCVCAQRRTSWTHWFGSPFAALGGVLVYSWSLSTSTGNQKLLSCLLTPAGSCGLLWKSWKE